MSDVTREPAGDPYARIADWYDAEHDAFEDDVQFYRDLAAGAGPTVLEVGCGSGRVTVVLARLGSAVTGVDSSEAMLARCRARLARELAAVRERVQLVCADARALGDAAPGPFALSLLPLNTFAHFATPAERLAVLTRVRERLVPGGRLVLDVDLQGPRRLLESPGQLWLLGAWDLAAAPGAPAIAVGSSVQVVHLASAVPHPQVDAAVVTHLYDTQTADGTMRRTIARMTLALLSRGEVELALERAGYAVESVYGSYELEPYAPGAERALFVAHTR
jgi:SAM-dependent methyltransferase